MYSFAINSRLKYFTIPPKTPIRGSSFAASTSKHSSSDIIVLALVSFPQISIFRSTYHVSRSRLVSLQTQHGDSFFPSGFDSVFVVELFATTACSLEISTNESAFIAENTLLPIAWKLSIRF